MMVCVRLVSPLVSLLVSLAVIATGGGLVRRRCEMPHSTHCWSAGLSGTTGNSGELFHCPARGHFPHPGTTQLFYRCPQGGGMLACSCRCRYEGMCFHPGTRRCEFAFLPHIANCTLINIKSSTPTTTAGGATIGGGSQRRHFTASSTVVSVVGASRLSTAKLAKGGSALRAPADNNVLKVDSGDTSGVGQQDQTNVANPEKTENNATSDVHKEFSAAELERAVKKQAEQLLSAAAGGIHRLNEAGVLPPPNKPQRQVAGRDHHSFIARQTAMMSGVIKDKVPFPVWAVAIVALSLMVMLVLIIVLMY